MRNSYHRQSGRNAVTLLATCIVVVGGAVSCAFVVTASSTTPLRALLTCGGVFVGVAFLLGLLRDKPPENATASYYSWIRRTWRGKRAIQYQLRRKPEPVAAFLPPAPPTVETVRELAGGASTWVPANGSRKRKNSTGESRAATIGNA